MALSSVWASGKQSEANSVRSSLYTPIANRVSCMQAKEDFPGNAKKLADDIKTAGW